MEYIKSALFGILQGLTEFLPVSSSGHLSIAENIFGLKGFDDSLLFTVILHLGTLISVFIVYYKDIKELFFSFFSMMGKIFKGRFKFREATAGERFVIFIFIAVLPLFIAVLLEDSIEYINNSTKIIGVLLIINALILFISDRVKNTYKDEKNASPLNALLVGVVQIIAIMPGISRSGTTITGGLFNGFSREFAVKFSFILSIPAILGANVFEMAKFIKSDAVFTSQMLISCIIGLVCATLAGVAAIKLINFIARRKNFYIFSCYCAVIGIVAIIFG